MPRIRKKTSKRGTTFQRSKVKHKVAESRKKSKKAAKKNPQWKSKHAKDPGIPNNFPYKDQILAEIAAQRRQDEEEKQKRKEQKRAAKALAKAGDAEKDEVDQAEEEDATAFDGISSLGASVLKATSTPSAKGKERATSSEEDEDVPTLMDSVERGNDSEGDLPSPPALKGKRKHHETSTPAPRTVSKKVTFAAMPPASSSKRARPQSSAAKLSKAAKASSSKAKKLRK